jgi:hypothetical protein
VIGVGEQLLSVMAVAALLTALGQLLVVGFHKRTLLLAYNLYVPLAAAAAVLAAGIAGHSRALTTAGGVATFVLAAMTFSAVRRRVHALGAGGELREHELSRRWVWQSAPARSPGERRFIGRQDELVHIKPWRDHVAYISMTGQGRRGPRLPVGTGQHAFLVGATGSGKTTTARRLITARVLGEGSSLVVIDQKGDPEDVEEMRRLAAAADVPFVLFDSQDPDTDRWQPLWGSADAVAAKATEAIKESEPYYYDVLRKHLSIVCRVLHAADKWPPSVPFLIDACEPTNYQAIVEIAQELPADHAPLRRAAQRHGRWVSSRKGTEDIAGGALRLETALALASSQIVTPRLTADRAMVGVSLVEALRRRSVVMWRTHVDVMPDEAGAITTLALADLHAAAAQEIGPWTLLLDEFGGVISTASHRALAILQRGRSHGGQVVVITQSVADVEALTSTPRLLDSLTDNFAAVVAHQQSSPDSRDWLARLMGTRELWQSTNQTDGHGSRLSGRGSSRRVREFRVPPDVFSQLDRGEAVIHTHEGRQAVRAQIISEQLPDCQPQRIDPEGPTSEIEMHVWAEQYLPIREAVAASGTHAEGGGADLLQIDPPRDDDGTGSSMGRDAI